jgi:hypothetical protein
MHEELRNVYKNVGGNPDGKRPFKRPRHIRDNIKMDIKKTGCGSAGWIHLAQDRGQWQALVNMVNEPLGSINFLSNI